MLSTNNFRQLFDKVQLGSQEKFIGLLGKFISVLFHKSTCIVFDQTGIMKNTKPKGSNLHKVRLESSMTRAFVIHIIGKCLVGRSGCTALIVQNIQNSRSLFINQIQDILIFWEGNKAPLNAFSFVFFLLIFQDKNIKLLLQSFVTIIDTELFKGIGFKRFKPKDIQYSNGGRFSDCRTTTSSTSRCYFLECNRVIDALD
mmetsp:Transcript_19593/g.35566  ORF Transcript_19593/g.35566 Transcript_19593/m.35566 type:complete len:200 (+) Transcript_19593:2808-3407(+)